MESDYDYGYLWEKFHNAVDTLVTGSGSIQTRVIDATMLNILPFKPEEIPEPIRNRFITICDQLTADANPQPGDGLLHASVNAMSQDEAAHIANEIFSLYDYIKSQDIG